jgi:hypothetical protein
MWTASTVAVRLEGADAQERYVRQADLLALQHVPGARQGSVPRACSSLRRVEGAAGMTKLRAPLTFSTAIKVISDLIGIDEVARITGRRPRQAGYYTESDKSAHPSIHKCFALDEAFLDAGGGYAPILESYQRQMEVARCEPVACRDELTRLLATALRECGDAWAHVLQALQPGASPAQIHRAIVEIEEADVLFPPMLSLLKALLPGTGAAAEDTGVRS